MYSMGYDIGSSSIKCSIINLAQGTVAASGYYPNEEMKIDSPKPGWAEQDPELWWKYTKILTKKLIKESKIDSKKIMSIGISYQMHGLVLIDKNYKVLRPSIIWCDSRAVKIGERAFKKLGTSYCLQNLLNSPGNFTASKLRWVKENEPKVYSQIYKMMLPGDYIASKLTGEISSTISGLSEGIFWDFKCNSISKELISYYKIDENFLPKINPTFSVQGKLTRDAAKEIGLNEETVVAYRAGDQPNNAFSLNVMNAGEIAATAGTSGVVYGVIDKINFDQYSRVNQFIHVNHSDQQTRLGVLLCINGTGIQNSWLRKNFASNLSYDQMNNLAEKIAVGSEGISVLPFGNGAERVLENKNIGSHIMGLNFNRHTNAHIYRAVQEGIAFSFKLGIDVMREMGLEIKVIRAGNGNMFASPIFRETLSNITDASIELFDTDGSQGAARGAAIGAGFYKTFDEAFQTVKKVSEVHPEKIKKEKTLRAYELWLNRLQKFL